MVMFFLSLEFLFSEFYDTFVDGTFKYSKFVYQLIESSQYVLGNLPAGWGSDNHLRSTGHLPPVTGVAGHVCSTGGRSGEEGGEGRRDGPVTPVVSLLLD